VCQAACPWRCWARTLRACTAAVLAGCDTGYHSCITAGSPRPDLPRAHSAGLETRGAAAH
jgi:hypothetical protein